MMQQACVRDLEIIGEASNHLTPTLKNKYNTVDWQQVKAFRNVVAHEYYKIDTKVVWQIIQADLPELKYKVAVILKELNK